MKRYILAAAAGILAAGSANAATIVNGSFEGLQVDRATANQPFFEVGTGNNSIAGWEVTSGSVDSIGSLWMAQDGNRSIDLAGSSLGTLAQTITDTIVGQAYEVSFYVSKNPDGGDAVRTGTFTAGANTFGFAYSAPNSAGNMNWQLASYQFVATSTSSVISFSADDSAGCCFGPALDNVSINAVPEPATWAMMIGGFGLVGGVMRRRTRTSFVTA